ncbi:hypothetical protein IAQ61_010597 [Plenodomus lingam]|uniref:uncharacterized protein n=1 Tax=Leptosphaeria maculans TaxID=5022 RepID=UPI003321B587|nr:hypothetical protein IAQ61_010597 [Plenodomus lingam]
MKWGPASTSIGMASGPGVPEKSQVSGKARMTRAWMMQVRCWSDVRSCAWDHKPKRSHSTTGTADAVRVPRPDLVSFFAFVLSTGIGTQVCIHLLQDSSRPVRHRRSIQTTGDLSMQREHQGAIHRPRVKLSG